MKIILMLIAAVTLALSGCGAAGVEGMPKCIKEKINSIAEAEVWNPPAKVYRYRYKGKTVYYFTSRCYDAYAELYDEKCILICYPDGGITGKGDGKCTDFHEIKTGEELIWEDTR